MRGSGLTTKEQYYLIGLFLGDGYAHHSLKDRHYRVEFFLHSERDKDIILYLKTLLDKLSYNYYLVKDKRYNVLSVRVNSKKLMTYLSRKVIELKAKQVTKDKVKVVGLLSGLIDSDGYVEHGEIQITQKDNAKANLIKNLAAYLNLTTRVRYVPNPKGNKIWRINISTQFKNFRHNSIKILRKYNSGERICTEPCSLKSVQSPL